MFLELPDEQRREIITRYPLIKDRLLGSGLDLEKSIAGPNKDIGPALVKMKKINAPSFSGQDLPVSNVPNRTCLKWSVTRNILPQLSVKSSKFPKVW